jgi:hypothetical protein
MQRNSLDKITSDLKWKNPIIDLAHLLEKTHFLKDKLDAYSPVIVTI